MNRPKVTLAAVQSHDGFITRGDEPGTDWASDEDQVEFNRLKDEAGAIIMGRKTYDVAKSHIVPDPDKPRIVLTRSPEKYQNQPGLEFTDASPQEVLKHLGSVGVKEVLLLGGGEINNLFIDEIDKIVLTTEPQEFGDGQTLFAGAAFPDGFTLKEERQLNDTRTTLQHFVRE